MNCTSAMFGFARPKPASPRGSARVRRGFTLVEMTAAAVLFTIAMALTVQVVGWVASERRAATRRQWAVREADNLMERITVRPWNALATDQLQDSEAAARIQSELPDGRLKIEATTDPAQSSAKRIDVEIRWKSKAGSDDAPVRLTAWVYRAGEPLP